MEKACGPVKAKACYTQPMTRPDPERLAAALRANLKKRKAQGRAVAVQPSYGSDEEGDVIMPEDLDDKPGAWVREGSKKV